MTNRWFLRATGPLAAVRLVLFPHAGGAASYYRSWMRHASPDLELCAVQYPGREARLDEPPPESLISLAHVASCEVSELPPLPTVFLGHSMGALVAYEGIRYLAGSHMPSPLHFIVSASPAPHSSRCIPAGDVSDTELTDWLKGVGGTPEEVLSNAEMLDLILGQLRCDLALLRNYVVSPGPPLNCAITVLTGRDDDSFDTAAWSRYTVGAVDYKEFPGSHHFIDGVINDVLRMVRGLAVTRDGASYMYRNPNISPRERSGREF
jgi:surfactin synthase thioesterase subunit